MLPLGGGSKRSVDNGVSADIRKSWNPLILSTFIWSAVSVLFILYGIYHCRDNAFDDRLDCDMEKCSMSLGKGKAFNYAFTREDIKHVEVVRVDEDNNSLDTWYHLAPHKANLLGYNVQVKFMSTDGGGFQVQKSALLSHRDMGLGRANGAYDNVYKYMTRKVDQVRIHTASILSVPGVVTAAVGSISLLLSCIVGVWSDADIVRRKKAN